MRAAHEQPNPNLFVLSSTRHREANPLPAVLPANAASSIVPRPRFRAFLQRERKKMDSVAINKQARKYRQRMVRFLRDLVAIPSESGQEQAVIQRIRRELTETRACDSVRVDDMGNLHARLGKGRKLIAIDAHVDTVGVGNREE